MTRSREGTLELRPDGYHAKFTITVKGRDVRKRIKLDTFDKKRAERMKSKLAHKINTGQLVFDDRDAVKEAARTMTFGEFRGPYIAARKARGVKMAGTEETFLRNYVNEHLDAFAMHEIDTAKINEVLEIVSRAQVKKGKTKVTPIRKGTVEHIRRLLHRMFENAVDVHKVADRNPVAKAKVPEIREVEKDREILLDEEIEALLSCPTVDLEIKMLSIAARAVGGQRTGDLLVWDWSEIDTENYASCYVPRRKTGKPQRLQIPEVVRPFLRAWHQRKGRPIVGPMFPVTKGKRKGEPRRESGVSFAKRLRRALKRAGVTRYAVHHETPSTLPVDFHSFRRAFSTALAEAGVNVQTAMALAGHSDPKTHMLYVKKAQAAKPIPAAVVPTIKVPITHESSPEGDE